MCFVKTIINKYNKIVKLQNDMCDNLIMQIDKALQEITVLFMDSKMIIDPSEEYEWRNRNISLFNIKNIESFSKAKNYKILLEKQAKLYRNDRHLKNQILLHNYIATETLIENAYELIGKVEGKDLDKQQMSCIVKDAHNQLVIAGAGTGKTITILGKIKFLLKSEKYKLEDILVLSFTNASASEMGKRIKQETGYNIDVFTFHKLGMNIITKVNGSVPKITQLNLKKFIKKQLLINMQSDKYLTLLSSYLLHNRIDFKSEFEFKTEEEYQEYLQLNPPTTINNEVVKSYGEMDIANFLFQNGIKYIYENPYEVDTSTNEYGRYKPDFYLPEYNIYIEYFGISKNGEVPSYFRGNNGMTASETYQVSMNWKKGIHKFNGTTLIECYAYEKFNGVLLENLKEKLIAKKVKLSPKTTKELWKTVSSKEGDSILDGVVELFETIINLIKSNGYTVDMVRKLSIGTDNAKNNDIILSLLEPIFNSYCNYLNEHGEIDFNDMINMATSYVKQGKYSNPYKYVIVDEYQDISKSRFLLLNSLRNSSDYNLFCVGDDWQSIYRFAGSDISYILDFEKYWGPTEISKIETTYRFTHELIDISSNFIMKNFSQIKKDIKAKNNTYGFILGEIKGYTEKNLLSLWLKNWKICQKIAVCFLLEDMLLMLNC